MVIVTPEAKDKLQEALASQMRKDLALRVFVKPGGGCSGVSYGMGLDEAKANDMEYDVDGLRVIIDPFSAQHLEGAEIGFKNEQMGGGFTITNPNAASGCGCGSAKKEPAPAKSHGGCGCGSGGCC
jgi:iron-sulfur cluster assembly protein